MIEDFLVDVCRFLNRELVWESSVEFRVDSSDFVVVDGEEGDYGTTKYFIGDDLVAVKTDYGGDSYDYEYTEFGKSFMLNLIKCKLDGFK